MLNFISKIARRIVLATVSLVLFLLVVFLHWETIAKSMLGTVSEIKADSESEEKFYARIAEFIKKSI